MEGLYWEGERRGGLYREGEGGIILGEGGWDHDLKDAPTLTRCDEEVPVASIRPTEHPRGKGVRQTGVMRKHAVV